MLKESPSKMGRKELEQSCEQLDELVEQLNVELEVKDKHIKHLTVNARNWSKKYYADLADATAVSDTSLTETADSLAVEPSPVIEPSQEAEASAESAEQLLYMQQALANSEAEKIQTKELLLRVNDSNVELMKRLQTLQAQVTTAKLVQARLEEKLEAALQEPAVPVSKVIEDSPNSESEIVELEFSPEMQKMLAKYAA